METFTIRIGGEAGQGLLSVGNILLKAIATEGWHLFAHQDYESRIRGGHNVFEIRLAKHPVTTYETASDVLVALDRQTIPLHKDQLKKGGVIIYDPSLVGQTYQDQDYVEVAFSTIAQKLGQPKVMANAAACGAIWALLSDSVGRLHDVLAAMFAHKGDAIVEGNRRVATAGYEQVSQLLANRKKPDKPDRRGERLLLKGNDALPSGALAAGLKFMSAYPMTPSTGVTEFVAGAQQECGVVMEQAEDEISAINMAIGAAFTGVRAMTATSGGGFALMTEALGLAASAEIPIVVIDAQRPGPSTGLPTRTEQGDLLYALGTSSGDFPRALLAPGDVEEAFYIMGKAFNLAERYQMPVIVLSDQHLADSYQTVVPFDLDAITIDRGDVIGPEQVGADYKRYQYTESGVSPRAYPGSGEALVVSVGDEHDEVGHLIEDAPTRLDMMEKRMRKMVAVREEALVPIVYGDDDPEFVLIGWGSTKGAIHETVQILQSKGVRVKGVHVCQVYPLAAKLESVLCGPGHKIVVEGNFSGQFAKVLGMEFAWKPDQILCRYDGRPLNPDYILQRIEGGKYHE